MTIYMGMQCGSLQFVYIIGSPLASAIAVVNLPEVHNVLEGFLSMFINTDSTLCQNKRAFKGSAVASPTPLFLDSRVMRLLLLNDSIFK